MRKFPWYVITMAFVAVSCSDAPAPPLNSARIAANAPDEESWNSTIVMADSTWTKARIRVGHVRKYISRSETLLDSGVYVEFLSRTGTLDATLISDSAHIDDRTRNMIAEGRVHVENYTNHSTVATERLEYDNAKRILHSASPVHIVDKDRGRVLDGVGFQTDDALKNYTIYKGSGHTTQ